MIVIYQLIIDDAALEQLRALPKGVRRNIGRRLEMLQNSFQGTSRSWKETNAATGFESARTGICFDWTARSFTCML